MPHVLYNHITHAWDEPAEDSWSESSGRPEEPVEFTPAARRVIALLALAGATAVSTLALWGLVAGLVTGPS